MPSAEDRIRAGGATLAFDTNALVARARTGRLSFSGFFWLCDAANRLVGHEAPIHISLIVPSLCRMEGFHDLRIDLAGQSRAFDAPMVERVLQDKRVVVTAFDSNDALDTSRVLHDWFPADAEWQAAKRDRCLEVLGVRGVEARGHGLASIDWAIAAQAEARGWVLVTDDEGAEFRRVSLKMKKSALRALFEEMLRERGLSAGAGS